jgi:hypothetical protein
MISFALDGGLCVVAGLHIKWDSQLLLACLPSALEVNTAIHNTNRQIRCYDHANIIHIALTEGTPTNVLHIYS